MSKKILIVDDDPTTRHLLESILSDFEYEVVIGEDGLDALTLTKEHAPDLIVLDVMIPEVNGYEVCFQLKFDEQYKKIPIILLTSREQELNVEIGAKAGIKYIKKPITKSVLLEYVDALLSE